MHGAQRLSKAELPARRMLIMSVNYPGGPRETCLITAPLLITSLVMSRPYLGFNNQHDTLRGEGWETTWQPETQAFMVKTLPISSW